VGIFAGLVRASVAGREVFDPAANRVNAAENRKSFIARDIQRDESNVSALSAKAPYPGGDLRRLVRASAAGRGVFDPAANRVNAAENRKSFIARDVQRDESNVSALSAKAPYPSALPGWGRLAKAAGFMTLSIVR
jgi:hypothetical protein